MATRELEEGTRNVIAECLGKLAIAQPTVFLPQLQKLLSSDNPTTRSTVITAIKYTFSTAKQEYDSLLAPLMLEFLRLCTDPELGVRKASLSALNAAAHSKPNMIRPHLSEVLRLIYAETNVRSELIIVVEMGPFKHKLDTGEPARKVLSRFNSSQHMSAW
jgi:cullin-associated NEDD8-dissociated protein 1